MFQLNFGGVTHYRTASRNPLVNLILILISLWFTTISAYTA